MIDRKKDFSSEKYFAQKCPVCNGFGTVSNKRKICHGCNGRGFIIIDRVTGDPVVQKERRKKDANKNYPDQILG